MFVTKRLLVVLIALASAGVGATMYVALLVTSAQGEATAPVPAAAPETKPMRVKVDLAGLPACAPPGTEAAGGGDSGNSGESGDFATNSGTIDGSQFNDGGFGDIGQQWWNVVVDGPVTNVNVTDDGTATVTIGPGPATTSGPAATPAPTPAAAPAPSLPTAPKTIPAGPTSPTSNLTTGAGTSPTSAAPPTTAPLSQG